MTRIDSVMTRSPLVTVTPDDPVELAERRAEEAGVRHLLITRDGALLGALCVCELWGVDAKVAVSRCRHRPKTITVAPETSLESGLALMRRHRVDCLPVLSEDGSLLGVLTRRDLRNAGVAAPEPPRCGSCGSTRHVRVSRGASICVECQPRSVPATDDDYDELGVGD